MPRLRLMHWKPMEAETRVKFLEKAGHSVQYDPDMRPRDIAAGKPDAILIDLTRMPSNGREVAIYVRGTKSIAHLPIIFAGGEPEKVAEIKKILPDATYTTWESVLPAIKKAIATAPAEPVVPPQMMERYRSRPVAQKLGITAGASVYAIDPPRNFPDLLGDLPADVNFSEKPGSITLWFIHDPVEYQSAIGKRRGLAKSSKLWILWPKGEAGKRAGVTQNLVRQAALDAGLVDYKICAVDQKWSAILFAAAKST